MKQTCILVLGMHRSGTSALTGLLSLLDVYLGSKLLRENFANEKGYFENNKFYEINEKLLAQINSSWDDVFYNEEKLDNIKEIDELKKAIKSEFEYAKTFAIKDPRLAFLFPVYEKVLHNLDINIKIILPYRNPIEVANSLNKRDGMPLEKGMLLWAYHFLLAEKFSRTYDRVFTEFDKLMLSNKETVDIISSKLSLDLEEKYIQNKKEIDEFLEPSLKHHNISMDNLSDNIPKIVKEILALKDYFNDTDLSKEFDALRVELFSYQKLFYNTSIVKSLDAGEKAQQNLQTKEQELSQTQQNLQTKEQELSQTQQELANIYMSRSWKITKPFREIANFLRYTCKMSALKKSIFLVSQDSFLVKKFIDEFKKKGLKSAINKTRDKMHREFILKNKNIQMQCSLNAFDTNTITILTTKHTLYVAHLLKQSLEKFNFSCDILIDKQSQFSDNLHIVICPQIFEKLPLNYIAYQMEQSVSSRWFTEQYFNVLRNSYAILDYSIENIAFLQKNDVSYKQLFLLPIGIYKDYKKYLLESSQWDGSLGEEAEVVFYGDPNNERRKQYLNELKKHFKVKVVSEKFGNDLYKELLSSKIVVNIHYYENALLETTRIYECLSLGLTIVSEKSSDMDEHQNLNECVNFTEIGNIEQMVKVIHEELNKTTSINYSDLENDKFDFYLSRMLLSSDLITFEQLIDVCGFKGIKKNKDNFYCLGLPENIERRESFRQDNKYGISIFDGLRHSKGWIGCGLSYKYLLSFAKENGLEYILICEDDVEFPENFKEEVDEILNYLSKTNNEWNTFSGLIADLNQDTIIDRVDWHNDREFIYINKMTSTVFNVYHKSFFDKIINWDNTNLDVNKNTIDRYIESHGDLKVITTNPFLVYHKEEQESSIWHFQNRQYLDMFENTNKLLEAKVKAFKSK